MTRAAHRRILRDRYRAILGYTGTIWILAALIMASPMLLAFWDGAAAMPWLAHAAPALGLGLVGWFLRRRCRSPGPVTLTLSEGAGIVLLSWVGVVFAGAATFLLACDVNFTQAIFESMSGWTTTGLSILDVTQTQRSVLLYRSVLEYAGGAGLAILMVSLMRGPTGPGLVHAEGRPDQLVPHVVRSSKLVMTLYVGYGALGSVGLYLAGMDWFDAVNHSLAAVSTGGFSTRPDSIGAWDSPAIEAVTIVLMCLGTLNFLTVYGVLRGRWGHLVGSGQVRIFAVLVVASSSILFALATAPAYASTGKAVRVAVFEAFSAASTTGFSTTTYSSWPAAGTLVLIILMIIGGGAGSTAGGIKQGRVYLMWRVLLWEIRRPFLPRQTVNEPEIRQGSQRIAIQDAAVRNVAAFVFAYLALYALGSLLLCVAGCDVLDAFFEMASALGTVGLSIGVTSPDAPPLVLWTETVAMFLGRLEILVVFIGLRRLFSDARSALAG